jgi:hypothetical protein
MRSGLIIMLIILGALMRLIPHAANFAPITAIALFSGAALQGRMLPFISPIGAMLISDWILSAINGYPFLHSTIIFVYSSYIITVLLGKLFVRQTAGISFKLLGISLLSSILFFVITNFGVWVVDGGRFYSADAAGLMNCYVAAIPFFRNALLADVLFTVIFFSSLHYIPKPDTTAVAG